jgi:hypothetical protein
MRVSTHEYPSSLSAPLRLHVAPPEGSLAGKLRTLQRCRGAPQPGPVHRSAARTPTRL